MRLIRWIPTILLGLGLLACSETSGPSVNTAAGFSCHGRGPIATDNSRSGHENAYQPVLC
jgi:hypothetical protein